MIGPTSRPSWPSGSTRGTPNGRAAPPGSSPPRRPGSPSRSTAARKGRQRQVLPTYTHPHVLVIDEVGCLSYGPDAANVLFQVVNDRHLHHRPMIFTTNKPLAAWGRVLHDDDLAQAILDRGRHLELRGPSYRTRHLALDRHRPAEAHSGHPAR